MARKKADPQPEPSSSDTKHAATQTMGPDGEVYYFDDAVRQRIEDRT